MMNTNRIGLSSLSFEDELTAAGFTRRRSDHNYAQNGLAFMIEDNWPVLRSRLRPVSTDPLLDLMGKCGLWKCVTNAGRVRQLFDLPPQVISNQAIIPFSLDDDESSPLEKMLTWALDTINGSAPADWTAPSQDEIHSMIPRHGLTYQNGTLVRQGELVHGERRLALRFRILHEIPEDLPEYRYQWLRRLLIDAQNQWRLVRVGFADSKRGSPVQAEVDLTGAPHSLLGELIATALPALRFVVGWVSTSAVFLVDGPRDCQALEVKVFHSSKDNSTRKGGERGGCD